MYLLAVVVIFALGYKVWQSIWPQATVIIGNQTLRVLVAKTPPHRFAGLSKRHNLGESDGMLFVFPSRAQHTMVMRAMLFSIDIVWIDNNTIIDIAPNVASEPGRIEAELTPYFARLPSTHVLELPAGFANKNGIKVGDSVVIGY